MNTTAILLMLSLSAADSTAAELEERGRHAFNLQRFDDAIDLLTQAYERSGSAALLFSIAQAHRKSDRCQEAIHFYERYQEECRGACILDPRTTGLVVEAKQVCAKRKALAAAPPAGMAPEPPSGPGSQAGPKSSEANAASSSTADVAPTRARVPRWTARVEAAGASLRHGELTALQGSFRGALGYEFGDGALRVGPSVGVELIPAAYEYTESGTLLMTELSARAVGAWIVSERVRVRAEAGLGVLIVSGQVAGQPVRTDRSDATSTLLTLVGAAGVDVQLVGPVGATATVQVRGTPSAGSWDDGLLAITFGGGLVLRW